MYTKFAVVTGASSGIGFELAKLFLESNYDILICSGSERIEEAKRELAKVSDNLIATVQADLSTREGVEDLCSAIRAANKPLNAIALNAGVGVVGDFARETDLEKELSLIDLNVRSTVHLAKLASRMMVEQGFGRMLFTSSIAADSIGSNEAVYSASKAFVQTFAMALREELIGTGVTVTTLQPGPTATGFFRRAGLKEEDDSLLKDDASVVAQQGFEAMLAGKANVVAGSFRNKLVSTMGRWLAQTGSARTSRNAFDIEPGPL